MSAATNTNEDRWRKQNELAANVVIGAYRIVKGCTLFSAKNDVTDQQAVALSKCVNEYCEISETDSVSITFALNTIFVEGQVMRSSRETYYLALELGEILTARGVNELVLEKTVARDSVEDWARVLTKAWRDEAAAGELVTVGRFRGIQCNRRQIADYFNANQNDSPSERAARLFATAVIALRTTYAEFAAGKFVLSPRMKRIARRLVFELERSPLELTALAVGARGGAPEQQAVSTAIIATIMALRATRSRAEPTLVALVSMISHAGRYRLLHDSTIKDRALGEDELDRLPANSVIALVQLGKLYPAARQWSTLSYESIWATRAFRTGALYRGRRSPLMLSRLVTTARSFVEMVSTTVDKAPITPAQAMHVLLEKATDKTDRALSRLLIGAVGLFPPGTLIELNSKEVAVVMGVPDKAIRYSQPKIRIVFTAEGEVCSPPIDVDLARQKKGDVTRHVRSLFHANEAQAKALQTYVSEARSASAVRPWEDLPYAIATAASIAGAAAAAPPPAAAAAATAATGADASEAAPPAPVAAHSGPHARAKIGERTVLGVAPAGNKSSQNLEAVKPVARQSSQSLEAAKPVARQSSQSLEAAKPVARQSSQSLEAAKPAKRVSERTMVGVAPVKSEPRVVAAKPDAAKPVEQTKVAAPATKPSDVTKTAVGVAPAPKRNPYQDEPQAPPRRAQPQVSEATRLGVPAPQNAPADKKVDLDAMLAAYMNTDESGEKKP